MRTDALRRHTVEALLLALAMNACAPTLPEAGPAVGTVTVGVSTSGTGLEGLTFAVSIEPGGLGGQIAADSGLFTERNVPAGEAVVRLTNVPARCRVDDDATRRVTVTAGQTTAVRFVVKCSA